jgi:uncharacterized protein (TIGR02145 family)
MKLIQNTLKITLFFSLIIVFSSCEKQELLIDDIAFDQELKAAEAVVLDQSTIDQINYLYSQIAEIEALVEEGQLNKGQANALIVKIENSIKSLENGNDNAAENQLSAFVNEAEDYVENGVIPEEIGEELIDGAETSIILTNGSFIDPRDGYEYSVVLIGDQLWMVENLKFLPEVYPPTAGGDPLIDNKPYYYVVGYYGNNVEEAMETANFQAYGVLYNWPAAKLSCPEGWHLPSDEEWKQLEMYLGMSQMDADELNLRGTNEGGMLKEEGTTNWNFPNNGATNSSGFSALPGSARINTGEFIQFGNYGYYWSSSDIWGPTYYGIWYRYLINYSSMIGRGTTGGDTGFSVRCIKD